MFIEFLENYIPDFAEGAYELELTEAQIKEAARIVASSEFIFDEIDAEIRSYLESNDLIADEDE